ncbi:CynX/NimT family MFS transporter [Salinisphaera sp.]|uniref:MFS transporter n=1 Tax=Salinisphaera sp. TaxID=1914330 RepID=UPI002D7663EE|nr:MFS transporter [Salinisphaera sp.]HET7314615.1 MFS transporter [Salinisphaera sp.]
MKRQQPLGGVGILCLLWLTGLYLRIPVLVAPPLSPRISADLGLGQAATGALTTLPVLMLAVGAVLGSLVVARLGPRNAVVAGLALAAAASCARGAAPPVAVLYAATALTGLGIAVMQPAMAALADAWCPAIVALAVGVYMNGMYCGEFASAGLTQLWVLPAAGGDWRLALVFWSLPAAGIIAALYLPRRGAARSAGRAVAAWPDWRSATMWRLGLLSSATSVLFMGTNAYMADIVGSRGDALQQALFWFNISQIFASLIMIAAVRRLVMRRLPLIATSLVSTAAGALMLVFGGAGALVAAFILGMATAMQLTLIVMAAPYLAAAGEAGRMTAGIFVIGYSIAFIVPLLGGLLAQATGTPWLAMLPMIVYAAATFPLALTLRLHRRPDTAGD